MPVRSALIQGKIIKDEKTQALSAMLESDGQNFKVVMLNPFGQRSRTLISEPLGWSRQQFIPDINLIDDAALLTSLLCVFAGPLYTHVSKGGRWVDGDLIEPLVDATATHKIIYSGDPWNTSSTYLKQINNPRKQINNKVVFELQLQAAPF
jgi:hypothetical protein